MLSMTRIERIDVEVKRLMNEYAQLTRGKMLPPQKAVKLMNRISALRAEKFELERNMRYSLGSQLPSDETERNGTRFIDGS